MEGPGLGPGLGSARPLTEDEMAEVKKEVSDTLLLVPPTAAGQVLAAPAGPSAASRSCPARAGPGVLALRRRRFRRRGEGAAPGEKRRAGQGAPPPPQASRPAGTSAALVLAGAWGPSGPSVLDEPPPHLPGGLRAARGSGRESPKLYSCGSSAAGGKRQQVPGQAPKGGGGRRSCAAQSRAEPSRMAQVRSVQRKLNCSLAGVQQWQLPRLGCG